MNNKMPTLKAIVKTIWYCIVVILITTAVLGGIVLLYSLPELDKLTNGWLGGGFVIFIGLCFVIMIGYFIYLTFRSQYEYYLEQSTKEEKDFEIIVAVTKYYKQKVKAKHKRLIQTDFDNSIKTGDINIKIKKIKEL